MDDGSLRSVLLGLKLTKLQVEECIKGLELVHVSNIDDLKLFPLGQVEHLAVKPKARAVLKELIIKLNGS
jgi:hypothetical protein